MTRLVPFIPTLFCLGWAGYAAVDAYGWFHGMGIVCALFYIGLRLACIETVIQNHD